MPNVGQDIADWTLWYKSATHACDQTRKFDLQTQSSAEKYRRAEGSAQYKKGLWEKQFPGEYER